MCSIKWMFLKNSQNSQPPKNTCTRVSFSITLQAEAETCGFVIKETLAQVFSCELCKFLNYTFSYRIPSVIASAHTKCIDIAQAILGQQKKLFLPDILYRGCRQNSFIFLKPFVSNAPCLPDKNIRKPPKGHWERMD